MWNKEREPTTVSKKGMPTMPIRDRKRRTARGKPPSVLVTGQTEDLCDALDEIAEGQASEEESSPAEESEK